MPYQNLEPVSRQLTIVVGLTVVGFMTFGLLLSYYRNVLFEQTLDGIRGQNETIRGKIDRAHRDLEYYRSAQFKDKYAKENLGLLRPGEKALIITATSQGNANALNVDPGMTPEQREAAYVELLRQMPVLEHWKLYLFQRQKIEELRGGL